MPWPTAPGWLIVKDVILTGTGVAVIVSQILSHTPDGLLIGAGLALTVPSTWDHVRALLPGTGEHSSPSSPPSGSPSSSGPPSEDTK